MNKKCLVFSAMVAILALSVSAGAVASGNITFDNIKKVIDERYVSGSYSLPDSVMKIVMHTPT